MGPTSAPVAPLTARIGDRATFEALRRSPRRGRGGPITITWVPGGSRPAPRVAFAISRKVGGAVERNRVRRRLRAICAEAAVSLPSGAYLISVAPGGGELSFWELRAHVHRVLDALAAKAPR